MAPSTEQHNDQQSVSQLKGYFSATLEDGHSKKESASAVSFFQTREPLPGQLPSEMKPFTPAPASKEGHLVLSQTCIGSGTAPHAAQRANRLSNQEFSQLQAGFNLSSAKNALLFKNLQTGKRRRTSRKGISLFNNISKVPTSQVAEVIMTEAKMSDKINQHQFIVEGNRSLQREPVDNIKQGEAKISSLVQALSQGEPVPTSPGPAESVVELQTEPAGAPELEEAQIEEKVEHQEAIEPQIDVFDP